MARTNFSFTKRQKELERKKKQEEKRQRKRDKKGVPEEKSPDRPQAEGEEGSQQNLSDPPPDQLNQSVGVLTRREIEARLLGPLAAVLSREFGEERALRVIRETVVAIARRQGADLAQAMGGTTLTDFRESLVHWTRGGALEMEVIEEGENAFAFNVTRCRYAEMYRDLGLPQLGPILSCSRDFALIEGFNPQIRLTRTQTLMEGAPFCDFRYRLP